MKKFWIVFILLAIAGIAVAIDQVYMTNRDGVVVEPGQLHTQQNAWTVIATIAAAGYEPNDLAVTERKYLTAIALTEGGDSKITAYSIASSNNKMRLRCIGATDNAAVTIQVYLGDRGSGTDCELCYAGQLAFTIGTQLSTTASYYLADTLAITSSDWVLDWDSTTPTNNRVAEAYLDLMGSDTIVLVPTTVACDCKILFKGY